MFTKRDVTFYLDHSDMIMLEMKECLHVASEKLELCVFETKVSDIEYTFIYGSFIDAYFNGWYDFFRTSWPTVRHLLCTLRCSEFKELIDITNYWHTKRAIYEALEKFDSLFTNRGRRRLEELCQYTRKRYLSQLHIPY
jgi:hypothetical protein